MPLEIYIKKEECEGSFIVPNIEFAVINVKETLKTFEHLGRPVTISCIYTPEPVIEAGPLSGTLKTQRAHRE